MYICKSWSKLAIFPRSRSPSRYSAQNAFLSNGKTVRNIVPEQRAKSRPKRKWGHIKNQPFVACVAACSCNRGSPPRHRFLNTLRIASHSRQFELIPCFTESVKLSPHLRVCPRWAGLPTLGGTNSVASSFSLCNLWCLMCHKYLQPDFRTATGQT